MAVVAETHPCLREPATATNSNLSRSETRQMTFLTSEYRT
jgi:hypothetical protein